MKLVRKFLNAAAPAAELRRSPTGGSFSARPTRRRTLTAIACSSRASSSSASTQNPILLFEHNHALPVGTGEVWAEGSELFVAPTFTRSSAKGREVENLVDEGVIRTVSIGFLPSRAEPNEFGGLDYLEAELLEISFVTVPANPNALRVKINDQP